MTVIGENVNLRSKPCNSATRGYRATRKAKSEARKHIKSPSKTSFMFIFCFILQTGFCLNQHIRAMHPNLLARSWLKAPKVFEISQKILPKYQFQAHSCRFLESTPLAAEQQTALEVQPRPTDFGLDCAQDGLSSRVVLDVRSQDSYQQGHLPGATSLPLEELPTRTLELPPPFEEEIWLCAEDAADLAAATELLEQRSWVVARGLTAVEIGQTMELEVGSKSAQSWRPTRFLRHIMNSYWGSEKLKAANSEPYIALDLGCGNGRDAIFLKQRLGPKWKVIGIDNHSHALDRAAQLAKREGLGSTPGLEWLNLDLRQPGALTQAFPRVNLVHGSRFLDRPLLLEVRDQVLKPGGLFLWSTFLEAEENLAPPFRPSRRLVPDELQLTFGKDANYDIIYDEQGILVTRSQPVKAQFFAAQKV